ncbi:Uncharacterised protein [Mycobacteroides abscessus subsp. massiliense]|uniref:hypothetical protein n=1 Tax=Mycobacteroides abscessus TaxID=36809 RepID=UPI0009A57FA9|nr:hypothetical protein [Mycobacteroides abscessus]SKM81307.1 Uncharacterised protein [Mycobacteroides abscessus subsp. massiliense]SKM97723.1 Uncharacterised protein [Mycobacteroides abscessus subsp. massiliense]SKN76705.1 Uncharacterised protein [Mycobacteroides abscessus subsp. massiliense]SKN96418.1 Uncharacterised protein [Mycobacteroides abscessus subsp. massiliense]SKO21544.1 Uncharacterised protein [Mycobacteroides abscessus subsp. massiliense]
MTAAVLPFQRTELPGVLLARTVQQGERLLDALGVDRKQWLIVPTRTAALRLRARQIRPALLCTDSDLITADVQASLTAAAGARPMFFTVMLTVPCP